MGKLTFIQTAPTGGDETAPFDVEFKDSPLTVGEFINEILNDPDNTWGTVEFVDEDTKKSQYLSYDKGRPRTDFFWKKEQVVKKITASGGWGRMDYRVIVKS